MRNVSGVLGIIVEKDIAISMRDGTILRANIYRPSASQTYPGLLTRTPYNKEIPALGLERYAQYVRAGYAVVVQDTRGRYASDGQFVPFYVAHTGDAEDGYDTVEWIARQPYCNGKVGVLGNSYNAWMGWMLAKLQPPHLIAMSNYSCPFELTDVDWPGAYRPGRRINWLVNLMAPDIRRRQKLPGAHTPEEAIQLWLDSEHIRLLGLMPWSRLPDYLPPGLQEHVASWMKEPNRKPWRFDLSHANITVPNLDLCGWFDPTNSSIKHLSVMQKSAATEQARRQSKIILGPWNHGGVGQRRLGEFDFGFQSEFDFHQEIIRWFDYWLKDLPNGIDDLPAVRYFVMGSQVWKSSPTWPPAGYRDHVYYLTAGEESGSLRNNLMLSGDVPAADSSAEYTYDPSDPVPTLDWDINMNPLPSNRRKVDYRQDILRYRTAALTRPVEVAGEGEVVLFVSSSATDTDFFARLVDEPPEGPALEVCYGMVKARHRKSLDREDFLMPGQITELRIKLGPTACSFLPGHRIRLEITSSDFPNYDRNHNTGKNDLWNCELIVAKQRIHHSRDHPSRVVLPILEVSM